MISLFRQNRIVLVIAIVMLATLVWSSALAGTVVPLKGGFAGTGSDFAGNFTHLGRFNGVLDPATFTAVWTAANGDTVTNQTISFELGEEVADGVFQYEQEILIMGGTGRFAGATGSALVTGTINLVTGAYDGYLDGTISRPGGN